MVAISSQQNKQHNVIFIHKRNRLFDFSFGLLFALILLFTDYHYRYLVAVRHAIALAVSPVLYIADYPNRVIDWLATTFQSRETLLRDNMQLKYQQVILSSELQKLRLLKKENRDLKHLLQTSSVTNGQMKAAEILSLNTIEARQLMIIDKGKREGVFEGQPVIDARGVMGQVIDVGYMTSTVLLISDIKSAIPVRNERTGEQAIVVGMNKVNLLSLINLPKSSSVKRGDMLITSGLGHRYPEGLPVGIVFDVVNVPEDDFIRVSVTPIAWLNRSRLVLLLWPNETQSLWMLQMNERMSRIKQNENL
jgi:rod shape-determining protein MreC